MSKNTNRTAALEKRLYTNYQDQAKRKALEFNIGLELFSYLINQKCHYCNSEPTNVKKDRFVKNKKEYTDNNMFIFYNGIDRIDSNLGYIKTNIVPCCKFCNAAKLDMSTEDFKKHIKKIHNHYIKDKNSE